jgi:hypothetical protein
VIHAVGSVGVVVIGRRHSTAGPLVLANGPVLEVVVTTIDETDLVVAAIAVDGTFCGAFVAWVIRAIVLEDLWKISGRSALTVVETIRNSRPGLTMYRRQDRSCLGRSWCQCR